MNNIVHKKDTFESPTAIYEGPANMEAKHTDKKWVLVHTGNDIAYGLVYVAGDLLRRGHEILWIDGEEDVDESTQKIVDYGPDYVCYGPLSTEFLQAMRLAKAVKLFLPKVMNVFGGHHVKAIPEEIDNEPAIDFLVWGPVYGSIDKIIEGETGELIQGAPTEPANMQPALREYYQQIPRMGNRERKYIMSHFGCVYNCSFCCTDVTRKAFGPKVYKEFWLARRPIENMIEEAKLLLEFDTKEVSFEDDDVLYGTHKGGDGTEWLADFRDAWKKEIDLPMYANVTPQTVVRSTPESLKVLADLVDTVQMGVQTTGGDSSKLFNRHFQDEAQVTKACKILAEYGIKIKLEVIIGLPNIDNLVPDPITDAIKTIQMCQRISKEVPHNMTWTSCFPLMLYPGTQLWKKSMTAGIPLNDACEFEWHSGEGSVKFDEDTQNKIRNMTKMATMFIKYDMSERWMRAIMELVITEEASRQLSECQYLESLMFRLGDDIQKDFDTILDGMTFKY
jgi:radical SAM superfamily enzyme YgiQ (UPF0313 family)